MTADDYFKTQLLLRSRALFRLTDLSACEQIVGAQVFLITQAAIGYCDQEFFRALARRLVETSHVPALETATKTLFHAATRDDPKKDVAEAAVELVFAAWQQSGSTLVEAIGQLLVNQVRYDNQFCRSCSTRIKAGSESPYCEQHEARQECAAEDIEREAREGFEKMTPTQRAEMDASLCEAEEESEAYTEHRDEELLD